MPNINILWWPRMNYCRRTLGFCKCYYSGSTVSVTSLKQGMLYVRDPNHVRPKVYVRQCRIDTNSQDFSRLWLIAYEWDINFVSNIKYFVPNKLLVPNILSHKSTGNTDSQWSLYLTFAVRKIIRRSNFDLENINNIFFEKFHFSGVKMTWVLVISRGQYIRRQCLILLFTLVCNRH